MNDKTYTVTLSRIEWTHVLAAITEIKHDTRRSPFVRQKYAEIGRAIREQIENQPTKETKQ